MTIGELAAIRAIVAVHAQHNRPKLLAALDAELERERACQQEVTPMQFEEATDMLEGSNEKRPGSVGSTVIPGLATKPKEWL